MEKKILEALGNIPYGVTIAADWDVDDIVRDAVMLGAAAIHPIITHRTEHVRSHQGAVGCHRRTGIASNNGGGAVSKG